MRESIWYVHTKPMMEGKCECEVRDTSYTYITVCEMTKFSDKI